jgi:Sec-independent protein secretion pathway component TatC
VKNVIFQLPVVLQFLQKDKMIRPEITIEHNRDAIVVTYLDGKKQLF